MYNFTLARAWLLIIVSCDVLVTQTCFQTDKKHKITFSIIICLGGCPELPAFTGGTITYDFDLEPPFPRRPEGTVATYMCTTGMITGNIMRTCNNGVWSGTVPTCGGTPPPSKLY